MNTMNSSYWSERYNTNDTGWDVGFITPPLKEYADQLTDKNITILIPGCGNSYEAEYLLQNGYRNITLIDISPVLCERLKEKLAGYETKGLQIICGDFFEHNGQYDLVLEQTFFCALDPSLRDRYAAKMPQLLKPGGKLVGLLFNKDFDTNPPFGGNEAEYRKLFEPFFTIQIMEPCFNSVKPRAGGELFIKLVAKK